MAAKLEEIKTGDIIAFRSNSVWSKLIRFRTTAPVSHVGMAILLRGTLTVIEAKDFYYIRVWPIQRYLEDEKYTLLHYELLDKKYNINRNLAVNAIWELWGERYASPWQFVRSWGVLTRRICDWLEIAKDTNEKRWHCSETIMHSLREGGYKGEGYKSVPAETTPGDIIQLPCLQNRGTIEPYEKLCHSRPDRNRVFNRGL